MKTLVIVDVQRDFYHPSGHLFVPGSETLPEKIAAAMPLYDQVVFTLDWHPADHCSFAAQGGPWPKHCVRFTEGAGLADALLDAIAAMPADHIHYHLKGCDSTREQYGAFETMPDDDPVLAVLRESDELHICGIAGEYCVKESAANLVKLGFGGKLTALTGLTASFDDGSTLRSFLEENSIKIA